VEADHIDVALGNILVVVEIEFGDWVTAQVVSHVAFDWLMPDCEGVW
jgi:hypothetical protein